MLEEALRQGFMECDRAMRTEESLKDEMAGCTALVVMTKGPGRSCGVRMLETPGALLELFD